MVFAVLPWLPFILLGILIVSNIIFFGVRIDTENKEEEIKKKSTSTMLWVHLILSSIILIILFFSYELAFIPTGVTDLAKKGFDVALGTESKPKSGEFLWTFSRFLILIHIVVNGITGLINIISPDSSVIVSWIYEVISSLVIIPITIFVKDKEIFKEIFNKAKKMKEKMKEKVTGTKQEVETKVEETKVVETKPVETTETKPVETDTAATDTAAEKVETGTAAEKTAFGKRQRRRNPPKRRKKRRKKRK